MQIISCKINLKLKEVVMKKNYFIFTVVAMFFLTVSFMGTAFAKRSNQMTKKSMSYPYLLITQSSGVNHKGYCKFQIIYMPRILPNTTKISTIINHKVISGEALNLKWDDVDIKNGVIAIKLLKNEVRPLYTRFQALKNPFNRH